MTLSIRGVKYSVRKHSNVQVELSASDCSRLNSFLLRVLLTQTCSLFALFLPLSWQTLPFLCLLKGGCNTIAVGAPRSTFHVSPRSIFNCLELFKFEAFISAFQHIFFSVSWEKACSALRRQMQPRWALQPRAAAEQVHGAAETCCAPECQHQDFS